MFNPFFLSSFRHSYAALKNIRYCYCGSTFTVVTADPIGCLTCPGDYSGRPCGSSTMLSIYNITNATVEHCKSMGNLLV